MKTKKRHIHFFKLIKLSLIVISSKGCLSAHAAWNNNAIDYVNTYGEKLQYKDGAFWFAQYGTAGGISSLRYAIIGFNTSTTFNGITYNFSAKVGADGSFKVVDERQSGSTIYTLWKLDYNTLITRLKKRYPSVNFDALSSKTVDSKYQFNAIMSVKYPDNSNPAGSINDDGAVLSSPVYTNANDILKNHTWYGSAPDEIRRLFGINCDVAASAKPEPIIPDLTHFRIENYDYKDPYSETYWVKPSTQVKFVTESAINTKHNVFPDSLYVRIYKGAYSSNNFMTMYQLLRNGYFGSFTEGSIGNITTVPSSSFVDSYSRNSNNYMASTFAVKFPDNGQTYGLRYTSLFNGQYKPYLDTGKTIKVDGYAPSVSGADSVGWTNTDVHVSITATDSGSGISSMRLYKNGTEVTSSNTNNLTYTNSSTGTTNLRVDVIDKVGNSSSKTFTHYIDKGAPYVSISTIQNTWKNTPITATISASDSLSGVNRIEYKLSGATTKDWTNYTGQISISSNGKTTIHARAIDNAGNVSPEVTAVVLFDNQAPDLTITANERVWSNSSVPVTISASDSNSLVNRIEYKLAGATTKDWTNYTGQINISSNGKTTIYARAYDNAGNVSSQISKEVWVDLEKPSISINTIERTWKNTPIKVSLSASDMVSNVNRIEYKLSGATFKDWTTYSGEFNISTNGKTYVYARAVDNAGNVSGEISKEVWFDNAIPSGAFKTNPETTTREININISSLSDTHSGVKEVKISNNSNFSTSTTYSVSGKTSDTVKFTLDKKSTIEENYTERIIYIRLYDTATNYTDYQVKTKLNPAKPSAPTITSPSNNNPLFLKGETVELKWTHNNGSNDFALPQTSATITVLNEDTKESKTININGTTSEYTLHDLAYGQYTVSIKTKNFGPHESDSAIVKFRYNKLKSDGLVRTIPIEVPGKLKYVSVATQAEIPKGCSVEGKLYYQTNNDGTLNYTNYKKIKITENYKDYLIVLPTGVSKLQIDLVMKNSTSPSNPYISPILDNITVYAR